MKDKTADIVVVGKGAAGLTSVLGALEYMVKIKTRLNIILIDHAPEGSHGGNTRWSPSYIRLEAPDSVDPDFEKDLLEISGGRTDPNYIRRLASEAPKIISRLQEHGIEFIKPKYYLSAGPSRIQPVGGGAAIIRNLETVAKNSNITIRYNCSAECLVTDSSGRITGVDVKSSDNGTERISANAVILATGGFSGNGKMLAAYFGSGGETIMPISPGTKFNTGNGIQIALKAGALASGDWRGMHAEPVDPRSRQSAPVVLVYPYGIVVDNSGKRFFDEGRGLVHETWEQFAKQIHFELPGQIAYTILDSSLFDIPGYERAIRSEVAPYQADTILDLAKKINVPIDQLKMTVEEYNAATPDNVQSFDASRLDGLATCSNYLPAKSNWSRPLVRPPFLAYPLVGAIVYTFGGIATNHESEVTGAEGPIPGLYAAGEITGHFFGTAPNAIAMLRALVFGWIAGRRAVEYCTTLTK